MRPLLLDLYCGAGLAADGYAEAGFDVIGVDVEPQPDYPYRFVRADALAFMEHLGELIAATVVPRLPDVIHASPPCQLFTRAQHLRDAQGSKARTLDLLTPTLEMLTRWHGLWVVENVPGSPGMEGSVVECGSAYGLGVRRHRLFKSNAELSGVTCRHKEQGRPWGVYHVPGDSIPKGGRTAVDVEHGRRVMGTTREIPWEALKEGVPPSYTSHVGRQLMDLLPSR